MAPVHIPVFHPKTLVLNTGSFRQCCNLILTRLDAGSELHDQLEFSRTEQLKLETERDDAEQQCDGRLARL